VIISSVFLSNFRCYADKKINFTPFLNIIYGANASGKTSIVEGVYCLSVTKSFKTNNTEDLIKFENNSFYVEGTIKNDVSSNKISIYYDKKNKIIKRNGNTYKKISDYLGLFNVVAFSSNDFLVFKSGSRERRNLFEPIFCQISKEYIFMSNYYKKLLKERNAALKRLYFENSNKLMNLLSSIDKQLIDTGIKIIEYRQIYLQKINRIAYVEHKKITNNAEDIRVEYQSTVLNAQDYAEKLKYNLTNDIKKGATSVGPHKDDYIFIINNKNIAAYGSQGQQRNTIITIKLAMTKLIYEEKHDFPVLLLDDVFSELDESRQNALLSSFDSNYQIIITTASIADLNENIKNTANMIKIEKE
jgi:DNA replication and repair protein RecF